MTDAAFAFLVHPRNLRDVIRKFPILKLLPEKLVYLILRRMKPVVVSKITGLVDLKGDAISGYIISIPITAKQMMEDRGLALAKMKQAVGIAHKNGVRIIGLGGLTASLSKGGIDLVGVEPQVSFTTGRAYTVKTVTDYAKRVVEDFNFSKDTVKVCIVGAAGSIGSGCAEVLALWGIKNFILIDLERKLSALKDKMEDLRETNLAIQVEHQLSWIKDADIIITATNAPEVVVEAADLKSGAIIINDAQPSDISPDIYNREDVLVIEGGVVRTPGIKPNFNLGLAERDDNFCCLAEVMILAHQGDISSHFTIGNLDLSYIDQITEKSKELNFTITRYQNDYGYLPQSKIELVRSILNSKN
jgi:fatty aldehyde-generating acyl-ACP reductase